MNIRLPCLLDICSIYLLYYHKVYPYSYFLFLRPFSFSYIVPHPNFRICLIGPSQSFPDLRSFPDLLHLLGRYSSRFRSRKGIISSRSCLRDVVTTRTYSPSFLYPHPQLLFRQLIQMWGTGDLKIHLCDCHK